MSLTEPTAWSSPAAEDEFVLDVEIIEGGPVIPELLRSTSDQCGKTCQSACTSCKQD